jgi:hypothetical protein
MDVSVHHCMQLKQILLSNTGDSTDLVVVKVSLSIHRKGAGIDTEGGGGGGGWLTGVTGK